MPCTVASSQTAERRVVRAPPDAIGEARPEAIRDRHGEKELERHDAEPRRERAVVRGERDDELRERERHHGVERHRADVHDDEDAGEEARGIGARPRRRSEAGRERAACRQAGCRRARWPRRAGRRRRRRRARRTRSSSRRLDALRDLAVSGQPPARTMLVVRDEIGPAALAARSSRPVVSRGGTRSSPRRRPRGMSLRKP